MASDFKFSKCGFYVNYMDWLLLWLSHIQSTMWILFISHVKSVFKLDYVADYIRNHNKARSVLNVASVLLYWGFWLVCITSALHFFLSWGFWLSYVPVTIRTRAIFKLQYGFSLEETLDYIIKAYNHSNKFHTT